MCALVDSDSTLRKGWFPEMVKALEKGDLIEGARVDHWVIELSDMNQSGRFLFGNNLMKTEAIKGVELNCRILEDELSRRYVESRGYRIYKNNTLLCDHFSEAQRYREEKYRVQVKRALPPWVYREIGRVDRLGGVRLPTALTFFFYSLIKNVLRGFSGIFGDTKKACLYLLGYLKAYNEEKTVKKGYKITLREKIERERS